jgi:hypothetical protein
MERLPPEPPQFVSQVWLGDKKAHEFLGITHRCMVDGLIGRVVKRWLPLCHETSTASFINLIAKLDCIIRQFAGHDSSPGFNFWVLGGI